MTVLATPRLVLRHFTPDDAGFIFKLVNDPVGLDYDGGRINAST